MKLKSLRSIRYMSLLIHKRQLGVQAKLRRFIGHGLMLTILLTPPKELPDLGVFVSVSPEKRGILVEIKADGKFYHRHRGTIPRIKFFAQRRYRAK